MAGPTDKTSRKVGDHRVHMANERTFLAWIRTSIGLMAFGFVIEKFAVFMKHLSFALGTSAPPPPRSYSSILGIVLVLFGLMMVILAFIRYKKVEKQIDDDTYRPSLILDILLTTAILAVGVYLVMYLVHSI